MKEKNYNLELVRMISFILVIAIHVSNYFCRAYGKIPQGEYLFSLVIDTVARLSVPCFFMISGALLLGRDEPVKKHIRRIVRFLTALVVWSLVYYFWNTYYMHSSYDLKEILYVPAEAHLWYLYAMIPIYLVLPFFQVMCRNMSINLEKVFLIVTTGAVLFNYVLWLMGGEAYYDLPLIGDRIYAWYVFVGYYLYKYRRHIRISQRALVIICVLSMTATFGITWGVSTLTGDHYEDALNSTAFGVVLTACIPMLMGAGGNCGSQASTLTIRGLALGEVELKDIFKLLWKEVRVGLIVGAVLSVVTFLLYTFVLGDMEMTISQRIPIALTIAVAVYITVIIAKAIGCTLPLLAKAVHLDPALMASPLITTIVDICSLLVLFAVATEVLHV